MARVVYADLAQAEACPFPRLTGVSVAGEVRSQAVIAAPDRPLLLWKHVLAPGAELRWDAPAVDQAFYALEGEGLIEGFRLQASGVVLVEHGASARLRAERELALLHFQRPEAHPARPARDGGHVHVIPVAEPEGRDPRTGMLYQIFADSGCPHCEMWLHRTDFPEGHQGVPHLHTTDEIIVVVHGEMLVGSRANPMGSALGIDSDTIYSFAAGAGGLGFINFRANFSERVGVTRDGRTPPMEEARFLRTLPSAPPGGWDAIARPTAEELASLSADAGHYLNVQARTAS